MHPSNWRAACAFAALLASSAAVLAADAANPFSAIGHIVVIYTENRSFDHVFGLFPGADGIPPASKLAPQVDADGAVLAQLPPPRKQPGFPERLPNAPFLLDDIVPPGGTIVDPIHDFYVEQEQIDGGKMDRFVEASNAGALVVGYRDGRKLKQWRLAEEFVLADHFFHAAFGSSMLNHFYLVCACAPVFPNAPEKLVAKLDSAGRLARAENSPKSVLEGPPRWAHRGAVTPGYFAVGDFQPQNRLSPADAADPAELLPPQTMRTIGDALTEKGVSWAWFAGGWNDVAAGRAEPYGKTRDGLQTHHQPFAYFADYGPRGKGRPHLKDAEDFFSAMDAGDLPQVSFYKPIGSENGHPGYSSLVAGDEHVGQVVARLRASPNWKDMLIIVTADENGGFWDHAPPPKVDAFGPGARVPALIISPFARKGFVDHTVYDTTSILKTIETRFGLPSLSSRDAAAADLRNALEAPR